MIWKSLFFNGLTEKEESVLKEFFLGFYRMVYIYIHLLTPDQSCAEEVTHCTLLRVCRNANFDNEVTLLASTQRIAIEEWLVYIKKKRRYYEEYLRNRGRLDAAFNDAQEMEKKVKIWKQLSPDEQIEKKQEYTTQEEGFATHYESPFMPNRQTMLSQSQSKHFATKGDIVRMVQDYAKIDPACYWESFKKQASSQQRKKSYVRTIYMAAASVILIWGSIFYFSLPPRSLPVAPGTSYLAKEKGAELILYNGSIIKLDSVPDGNFIATGVPFKKEGSKLVYVNMEPNDLIPNPMFNVLSIPPRRQYQIVLSDSSVIDLNASSQLHFPVNFSKNERLAKMEGEAFFHVNANKAKPFFVQLKDSVIVTVLGTSFNIDAHNKNDYIKATLIEGRLKITANRSGESKLLRPGQQAHFAKGNLVVNDKLNVDHVMAWKEGRFVFEHKSIPEIMEAIGPWYNVNFIYRDGIPTGQFSASFNRSSPLTEVIKILSIGSGIHMEIKADTIIVSSHH
jgi:transmembrane sensor